MWRNLGRFRKLAGYIICHRADPLHCGFHSLLRDVQFAGPITQFVFLIDIDALSVGCGLDPIICQACARKRKKVFIRLWRDIVKLHRRLSKKEGAGTLYKPLTHFGRQLDGPDRNAIGIQIPASRKVPGKARAAMLFDRTAQLTLVSRTRRHVLLSDARRQVSSHGLQSTVGQCVEHTEVTATNSWIPATWRRRAQLSAFYRTPHRAPGTMLCVNSLVLHGRSGGSDCKCRRRS